MLLSKNFLSVKKTDEVSWNDLNQWLSHLITILKIVKSQFLKENKKIEIKNLKINETVKKIIDVLDTKIRPAVARDGGDIKFKSFEDGVVKVELQGSCSGCPSSLMTLKQGVQNLLKHYVKEVNSVEASIIYEKKLSYRDKLLELAYIYNVKEIQEYTKRRKNLTTGQIELILKKKKLLYLKILRQFFQRKFYKTNIKIKVKYRGF